MGCRGARGARRGAARASASFTLVKTIADRERHLAGSGDHQEGALLSAEDVPQGQALVPRQCVLAGDRLADVLTSTFAPKDLRGGRRRDDPRAAPWPAVAWCSILRHDLLTFFHRRLIFKVFS
jgi:hypothetical protein